MRFDPENNRVYVRQSWLGDFILCPQRSRYGLALPSMRRGSDATVIGTGVHAGIESVLRGDIVDYDSFYEKVDATIRQGLDSDIKRTEISADPEKMNACISAMSRAWWDDIRPIVPMGGLIEHKFQSPTGMLAHDGTEIWFEGTIDYVAPDGVLWDWKTSSRTYYAKEKQAQSHQATVYVDACRSLGLVPDGDEPTPFRFGVMVRQEKPKSQVVTVLRGREQIEWCRRQTASAVNSAMRMWGQPDWTMVDTSALCSSKWCDFWYLCKGAHWTDSSLALPDQTVPNVTEVSL